MDRAVRIDLFCEDSGHEQFVAALLRRLGREEGVLVTIGAPSSRGGHGRVLSEFRAWQKTALKGLQGATPDLLVLVVDSNCQGWSAAQRELSREIDHSLFPRSVVGCPDPHVERWCLADPRSFAAVVGGPARKDPGKCERELYKQLLRESIRAAGQPILTNEMEYAADLVEAMSLFRAGKNQPSLKHFVGELRGALRSLG